MNGDPRSPPAREDAGPPAEHPDGAAMRAARQASPHRPFAFPLGCPSAVQVTVTRGASRRTPDRAMMVNVRFG